MISYESARKIEIELNIKRIAKRLVDHYDPNKKTVIMLPGGMGSRLERSKKKYPGPFDAYDVVWIDFDIIFGRNGDARALEIQKNGRDEDSYIVIPNGPFAFFVTPYDGTEKFFRDNGYNYAVFGFDWRRPIEDSARWLKVFLDLFRNGVIKRFQGNADKDPLPTTTLLCHSMGGLVAKIFLHLVFKNNTGDGDVSRWMENMITVATPFYGTSNHIHRYYEGIDLLNLLYGPDNITRIAASLDGPYILLFLDKFSYDKDGATLGLTRYPVRDANNNAIEVDPYDPSTFTRYPKWVKPDFLNRARQIRKTLVREVSPSVIKHVFHVRSGQNRKTWVEKFWKPIDGSTFKPGGPSPISGTNGEGDGTVPFWSARLAQTPIDQIYDLQLAKDHMSLLEHEETLKVVKRIIDTGKCPKTVTAEDRSLGVSKASKARTDDFVSKVKKNKIKLGDLRSTDPDVWRRLIEDISLC